MSSVISACLDCENLYQDSIMENPCRCKAFPEGIPNDIFWSKKGPSPECNKGFCFTPDKNE